MLNIKVNRSAEGVERYFDRELAVSDYGAVALVAEWLQSFKEFPPRQKPASFNLDEVMRNLSRPNVGND